MTLFEALERIGSDKYAEVKSPEELAALINPWLGVNIQITLPYSDNAPFLLRKQADAPRWRRFDYSDPVMRQLSAAHFVLRAAGSLGEMEDTEPCLNLIRLGRKICRETLTSSPLASRRPIETKA